MRTALVTGLWLLLAGCAVQPPPAPPAVVIAPALPATPGSLWTDRQGALFQDVKARAAGDLVTVAIFERASAKKEAKTATARKSSASAKAPALFGLERNIATINKAIDPASLLDTEYENDFEGAGSTSREENLVATLTAQVVEVLPNGNLRIEGRKTVTVNREQQLVSLAGIVRPADISPANVVDSQNILDARIDYSGKGVLSDKQGQGWLVRILDHVWPF